MWSYDWYWKNNAQQYGYKNVGNWLPGNWKDGIDAFSDKNRHALESLKDTFLTKIYNESDLAKHDDFIITKVIPDLDSFAEFFGAVVKKQGVSIPDQCAIISAYGNGGSYNYNDAEIIARISNRRQENIVPMIKHEFVHILIERPIIEKFHIPQDVKESVVDIICEIYFNKPTQDFPILPFVRKYINKSVIENDLSGVAKTMMADYAATQANKDLSAER
jgi:hypothetical protein